MIDSFVSAAEAAGCVVKLSADLAGAAKYISGLADGCSIAASYLPPEAAEAFKGINLASPADYRDANICLSYALAGIADTGTLLLDLSDPIGRAATALPPVHAVLLKASTIVSNLASLAELITSSLDSRSAYLSLTTGPSRTADIERVLTIGVHGPRELHVVVIEGE